MSRAESGSPGIYHRSVVWLLFVILLLPLLGTADFRQFSGLQPIARVEVEGFEVHSVLVHGDGRMPELEELLLDYKGTLLLVSHDRALLRSVCDEFWLVSKGGVAPFDGDLEDYQRYLLDEARKAREEAKLAA